MNSWLARLLIAVTFMLLVPRFTQADSDQSHGSNSWLKAYLDCNDALTKVQVNEINQVHSEKLEDVVALPGFYDDTAGVWLVQDEMGRFVRVNSTAESDSPSVSERISRIFFSKKERSRRGAKIRSLDGNGFIFVDVQDPGVPSRPYVINIDTRARQGVSYQTQKSNPVLDEDLLQSFQSHLRARISSIERRQERGRYESGQGWVSTSAKEVNQENKEALDQCQKSLSGQSDRGGKGLLEVIRKKLIEISIPEPSLEQNYDGSRPRRIGI